jgi:hypothetical protein
VSGVLHVQDGNEHGKRQDVGHTLFDFDRDLKKTVGTLGFGGRAVNVEDVVAERQIFEQKAASFVGVGFLKRIFSFAYSVAKLYVTVSSPPLVIIGTEAVIPAIGLFASKAVMVTTLPPDLCASICLTTPCVMKRKPSRLVEDKCPDF